MLNFNNPVDNKTSWQEHWKILIYDNYCRDIISTLFKVPPPLPPCPPPSPLPRGLPPPLSTHFLSSRPSVTRLPTKLFAAAPPQDAPDPRQKRADAKLAMHPSSCRAPNDQSRG